MIKLILKIKYWIFIVYLSFRWIFQINIGNMIKYKNKIYVVRNGDSSGSWKLSDFNYNNGYVPRKDCSLVLSVSNLLHSFKSGYNFYMKAWYGIWVNEGIKDWMKGCNIWPRK